MDTPMNALMHAIMTVRDLPPAQREIWQEVFRHYVFEPGEATAGHIPEAARRLLSTLDETQARELRALLLQRLNRCGCIRGCRLAPPARSDELRVGKECVNTRTTSGSPHNLKNKLKKKQEHKQIL